MRTVNIHEVKMHLSQLVERVAQGEPFVIAKAGRHLVKVMGYCWTRIIKRLFTLSCITARSTLVGLISACIATMALAGQTTKLTSHSHKGSDSSAVVTMANNAEIRVEQIRLQESPGGQWITARPNRYVSELYYQIRKDNVTIRRVVPFATIASIEFSTSVASDAIYPEVRRMLIKLRDGGTIEWIHANRSVTVTSSLGKTEQWDSFPWISGVVSSGEKEQGQDYAITGFTGLAIVNGERGQWEAKPTEIKQIRFNDGSVHDSKP